MNYCFINSKRAVCTAGFRSLLNFTGHIFKKFDVLIIFACETTGCSLIQFLGFRIDGFFMIFLYPNGFNQWRLANAAVFRQIQAYHPVKINICELIAQT